MTNMATSSEFPITCDEFLEFQESLKKLRLIDDRIIYALNTTLPTVTFEKDINATKQCKLLYENLMQVHNERKSSIHNCIKVISANVNTLKDQRSNDPNDLNILKELRRVQTNKWKEPQLKKGAHRTLRQILYEGNRTSPLRLLQSELTVEEVVRDRSLKVFNERCRLAYKPPKHLS